MIFVFGGASPDATFDQNEALDPRGNDWFGTHFFKPMPTARHGLAVVTVRDRV
ncbi:MAG: hypothetical protein KGJ80_04035 [Chloroflexota bacterium]|nr:hypothetical protein [Chloroflexota bacterium]